MTYENSKCRGQESRRDRPSRVFSFCPSARVSCSRLFATSSDWLACPRRGAVGFLDLIRRCGLQTKLSKCRRMFSQNPVQFTDSRSIEIYRHPFQQRLSVATPPGGCPALQARLVVAALLEYAAVLDILPDLASWYMRQSAMPWLRALSAPSNNILSARSPSSSSPHTIPTGTARPA